LRQTCRLASWLNYNLQSAFGRIAPAVVILKGVRGELMAMKGGDGTGKVVIAAFPAHINLYLYPERLHLPAQQLYLLKKPGNRFIHHFGSFKVYR